MQNASQWKYEVLYSELSKNPRFCCVVVIIPNFQKPQWQEDFHAVFSLFSKKEYNLIKGYDLKTKIFLEAEELNADIIFYSQARDPFDKYFMTRFPNSLPVYVPYTIFCNEDPDYAYNKPFHNLLWAHFVPSPKHLECSMAFSIFKGKNTYDVGYTGCDVFHPIFRDKFFTPSVWKSNKPVKKRIIWAPHHTIGELRLDGDHSGDHSTFLTFSKFMQQMAVKYSDKIELAFKPHPNLKQKLFEHPNWGRERTIEYYNAWGDSENTSRNEGRYESLFVQSDAMIHDSVSFMAEYIFLKKPVMYLVKDKIKTRKTMNEFGLLTLDLHELGHNEEEVETFIKGVISGKKDKKIEKKQEFLEDLMGVTRTQYSAKRIISTIEQKLGLSI